MQQGLLGRISRTSILEYHAFGIIVSITLRSCEIADIKSLHTE
jgi:hypothetical protein